MGKLVTFSQLPYKDAVTGVKRALFTGDELKHFSAEMIRLAPGAKLAEKVPAGSDRYLFTLTGEATLSGNGNSHKMIEESFATIQEGVEFTFANETGAENAVLSVLAPPPGSGEKLPGFTGGIAVTARKDTPVVDLPAEKKRRIYFCGKHAARTERGHAMIVLYVPDTVTTLHMHPNADAMFVFLSGKVRFTINGADVIVTRGQATCLPVGDRHGLRVAEGDGVSFLEFHIPGAFTTVRN
jgi:mannose-6-phosphate isomerase-like protein (cupin superfamily)